MCVCVCGGGGGGGLNKEGSLMYFSLQKGWLIGEGGGGGLIRGITVLLCLLHRCIYVCIYVMKGRELNENRRNCFGKVIIDDWLMVTTIETTCKLIFESIFLPHASCQRCWSSTADSKTVVY